MTTVRRLAAVLVALAVLALTPGAGWACTVSPHRPIMRPIIISDPPSAFITPTPHRRR